MVLLFSFILLLILIAAKRKEILDKPGIIMLVLIDSLLLFVFIFLTGVVALCDCYEPSIKYTSYAKALFFYIFDSITKATIANYR